MLGRVALVITDISEDHRASIIRVTGIGELERVFVSFEVFTAVTIKNGVF
jgi:hypothetical protein